MTRADDHRAQARRLYAHGVLCQQQSRLAAAIGAWREALTFDPLHADARYNLAVGLNESGELAGAEKAYSDLLSIRPDHLQALYNLGNLRMRQGACDVAEPLYRRLLAIFEGRILDLSPSLRDFADTAAAVAALDLVISIDTSVAHLVGAMGKPGWVLISTAREWRWAAPGSESAWYPSLRLFRQKSAGDWSDVVCAIAAALRSSDERRL